MKVGDLVRVAICFDPWSGQLGIIVEIDDGSRGYLDHGTMLLSGNKRWFDLDELELVK